MAGRPVTRSRKAEEARKLLVAATAEENARELADRTPDDFVEHRPPKPPALDALPVEEIIDTLEPEEREVLLHELWPLAVTSIEDVLNDPDASAASKVQAARLVADMKKKQMDEEASKLPTRIIFETATYVPPEAA